MKKKILYSIALVLLSGLVAGGTIAAVMKGKQNSESEQTMISETEPVSEETALETETLLEDVPSYPAIPLELPELHHQDTVVVAEAEHTTYSDVLHLEERSECSNGHYLSGVQESAEIDAAFMLPTTQHYDITLSVRAEQPSSSTLMLNGEKIGSFELTDTEHFTRVTFSGIYLPAGRVDLTFQDTKGIFSIDYFQISNNTELKNIKYQNLYSLSDKQASPHAQKLMHFLVENYGKYIITGQYVSSEKNTELDTVCEITGKYPAIRFSEIQTDSENSIQACEQWSAHGGINGLTWYWNTKEYVLSETLPSETDIALLSETEIQQALEEKQISKSCASLLEEIDKISELLKPLADKDIPILWRPLPEAGGGWYWWGADGAEAYCQLWDILYRRMTEYHGLHNFIWLWNGQNQAYLVDTHQYDIASMDIYLAPEQPFNSRYEEFISLYRMTKHQKLLALSECGTVPDMNQMFLYNTIWSFMGLWYDDYLSEINSETLSNFYNSEKSLTLEDVKNALE